MPLWLMILQVVIPMVKTVVDLITSHAPAADAPQAHKDLHAALKEGAESFHAKLVDAHESMKA